MRNYDVTLIFSPLLEETAINDLLQKLSSFVQEKGGILGEQQIRGKRPLLAPIGKHHEGYLVNFSFTLSAEHLEEFEKYCKEQKDLLRFLVAKHIKHQVKKSHSTIARTHAMPTTPVQKEQAVATGATENAAEKPEHAASQGSTEEKIDLEDIDKKLEEIFKEGA